jgi:ParB family transcriptional regulator, chromosome partitioning protein
MLDLSALELDDEKKPVIATVHEGDVINNLDVSQISPGRYQPRREFDEAALQELGESIKTHGVMQPIVVRRVESGFEIIAGERRWRATKLAGLNAIPAIIREIDDKNALAIALVENIQREDLLPMEEAMALQRLKEEFKLKNKEVAKAVGKPENDVNKLLSLLKLESPVSALYEKGCHSVEVLIELNRAYGENPDETAAFIGDKEDITLREVRAFRTELKDGKQEKNSLTSFSGSKENDSYSENQKGEGAVSGGSGGGVKELAGEEEQSPQPEKELETDNGELTSFPRGKAIADPDRLKKPLLLVDYEGRAAAVLLNRKPKSPGVVFIRYEDGGGDEMVSVDKLKIIQLSEE